jgi:hypothetical protein
MAALGAIMDDPRLQVTKSEAGISTPQAVPELILVGVS